MNKTKYTDLIVIRSIYIALALSLLNNLSLSAYPKDSLGNITVVSIDIGRSRCRPINATTTKINLLTVCHEPRGKLHPEIYGWGPEGHGNYKIGLTNP